MGRGHHSREGPAGLDLHAGLAHPPVPGSQGETGEGAQPGVARGRGNFGPGGAPEPLLFLSVCHCPHLRLLICEAAK